MMKMLATALSIATLTGPTVQAQAPNTSSAASADYFITTVAERRVCSLPAERPLFWRIETFASASEAKAREDTFALATTVAGRHWLFTLGERHASTQGATMVAEIGPIPVQKAKTYLLRINHAGGPPGSQTSVHSHPGAEAIYVLTGEVTQQTRHIVETAKSGEILNAHEGEMVMQLRSTGTEGLQQLVMFVVDADRPFSPPANF